MTPDDLSPDPPKSDINGLLRAAAGKPAPTSSPKTEVVDLRGRRILRRTTGDNGRTEHPDLHTVLDALDAVMDTDGEITIQ